MGTWLFFLFNGGGLRCCPFPAAWEKCSPLPQQTHQDRHCKHLFLCKGVQFSKNYVGQQFKLIGLTSHWHWCRGADMIYCRAELGGRKDGESNMVWCITDAWSRTSESIRCYNKGRYFSHPENSLCCHAETSLLVQKNLNRSLCLPKCYFHIKSHAQKFTVTFDSRLKAVSAAVWKTGDIYRNFQDACAASQCEYSLLKG